jgi:hypothetical protein
MLQLFTPQAVGPRHPGLRLLAAGATVGGLALAGVVAMGALAALFLALAVIYFLVTEVLGIRLDVDPSAFVAQAQRYAQERGRS